MKNFYNTLLKFGVTEQAAKAANSDLDDMIDSFSAPSEYWTCRGTGSFKECYFIENTVVKFASVHNFTLNREEFVYQKLVESGLNFEKIFAKTSFLALDNLLPSVYINNGTENFDYIVIQEKVSEILGETSVHEIFNDEESYEENPLYDGYNTVIPYWEAEPIIALFPYQEWVQAGIDFYGLGFMKKLASFCAFMNLYDFHEENLGYREDGSPVIFDFLS